MPISKGKWKRVDWLSTRAVWLEKVNKQISFFNDRSKVSVQGVTSFVDHFCYLCFLFVMLSCLFIAVLWSPGGKGLASWLSCMLCFIVFLSLSHVVSMVRHVT